MLSKHPENLNIHSVTVKHFLKLPYKLKCCRRCCQNFRNIILRQFSEHPENCISSAEKPFLQTLQKCCGNVYKCYKHPENLTCSTNLKVKKNKNENEKTNIINNNTYN